MTEILLPTLLDTHIDLMEKIGAPAVAERFVQRNGTVYQGNSLPEGVRRGPFRACFRNAYYLATKTGLHYVEGFALPATKEIRFMPYAHAWVADDEGNVLDNTWERPEQCEYLGVSIPIADVEALMLASGVFGVLDATRQPNRVMMYQRDPELMKVVSVLTKGVL